jgi:hypothetical protein
VKEIGIGDGEIQPDRTVALSSSPFFLQLLPGYRPSGSPDPEAGQGLGSLASNHEAMVLCRGSRTTCDRSKAALPPEEEKNCKPQSIKIARHLPL